MEVINTPVVEYIPIKSWCPDIEESAFKQASNLAKLPFAFKHIALMPDAHMGYGMPIGGVLATKGVVIPNAVGVDIGCGMCAVKLPITEKPDPKTLKYLMGLIRREIPVGFNKHNMRASLKKMPKSGASVKELEYPVVHRELDNARKSLGTLGGGNHFIEIQYGSDGHVWVMIHSGSRNLGKQVADYYNKLAIEANDCWESVIQKEWQLAFLPLSSPAGQDYLREMQYCVDFALLNRKEMMHRVVGMIYSMWDLKEDHNEIINIAHNYAKMEHHFDSNVMVHRKGATLARKDTIGIIPGSQGSSSFIVQGKGNPESFMSCSHGAGRIMGRKQARRELDLEAEKNFLDAQNIIHSIRTEKDLDEAKSAYKDIDEVMRNQNDLVDVLVRLQPLAVIKG